MLQKIQTVVSEVRVRDAGGRMTFGCGSDDDDEVGTSFSLLDAFEDVATGSDSGPLEVSYSFES